MSFPCRTHYSVFEVMARWGATITDMRFYLESGRLQAQALLDDKLAQVYHRVEMPDGEVAWIKKSVTTLNGYAVVQPEKLRKIFRLKSTPVHKFKAVEGPNYYKLLREKDACQMAIDDLWIADAERARFEAEYEMTSAINKTPVTPSLKTGIFATSSGRPSVMKRITERHRERVTSGEAMPSKMAEAKFLHGWAIDAMPNMQIPSLKRIRNQLYSAIIE
jgi:hypothetical protein